MSVIADYRLAESTAHAQIDSWWVSQAHNVDHFIRTGFPVRLNNTHEVGQLLDTMQERRYEAYLRELDGLSEAELHGFVESLVSAVRFQRAHLPRRRPIIPLSTMISVLALRRKILGFRPNVGTILEVGPGCGYLSFMMARHAPLIQYAQVEACESFYILQNMINRFLFAADFSDKIDGLDRNKSYFSSNTWMDPPIYVDEDRIFGPPKCLHLPWWELQSLVDQGKRFDVVTSNANLLEFTKAALQDYLGLFKRVLRDDGIFLVQCTGFPANSSESDLFDTLHKTGFAPIFCALGTEVNVEFPRPRHGSPAITVGSGPLARFFTLNNLVLVADGHPLYSDVHDRANYRSGHVVWSDSIEKMYFTSGACRPSRAEVTELVLRRLQRADAPR